MRTALLLLAKDPSGRSHGLDVKRLDTDRGQAIYRLRIGEYRASFTVTDEVLVLRIFHRSDGYGWLADMD